MLRLHAQHARQTANRGDAGTYETRPASASALHGLFKLIPGGAPAGNRAMVGSLKEKHMELTNPRPIFLNDPHGWHWCLTWKNASGHEIHRVESNKTFATEVEARTDFRNREAELFSQRHRVD